MTRQVPLQFGHWFQLLCRTLLRFPLASLVLTAWFLGPSSMIAQENPPPTVSLMAPEGTIVGRTARLDHNYIEAWTDPKDYVKWTADFPVPGIYNVIIEYGYGGATGSIVEVAVGDQGVQTHVVSSLDWENIGNFFMGQVEIKRAGPVPVNLTVIEKHGQWIMNLRAIRLVRTDAKALQEPAKPAVHPAVP